MRDWPGPGAREDLVRTRNPGSAGPGTRPGTRDPGGMGRGPEPGLRRCRHRKPRAGSAGPGPNPQAPVLRHPCTASSGVFGQLPGLGLDQAPIKYPSKKLKILFFNDLKRQIGRSAPQKCPCQQSLSRKSSGPKRQILHELGGGILVVRANHPCFHSLFDKARGSGTVPLLNAKTLPQGRVREVLPLDVFQTSMKVRGPDSVFLVHVC